MHAVVTIIAVALLGSLLAGSAAAAPPAPPLTLDHFRCYSITVGHPAAVPSVRLEDQFDRQLGTEEEVFIGLPIGFCPPVEKTVPGPGQGQGGGQTTEIRDPAHHLTLYEIHDTTTTRHPTWKVKVDNQFGEQMLTVTRPRVLGVPTHKVAVDGETTGLPAPQGLNHFKCYAATGRTLDRKASLADQFKATPVVVKAPVLFCNPVKKTTGSREEPVVTPIADLEAHLTCYDIDLDAQIGVSFLIGIQTVNQFNHIPLEPLTVVADERVLCVPSRKVFELGLPSSFKAP